MPHPQPDAAPAPRHTAGPWQWTGNTLHPANRDPQKSAVYSILDRDGGYGFLGSAHKDTNAELDACFQLIKTAPELFDALQWLHRVCKQMDAEIDGDRPDEAEYQAAMLSAELALAAAVEPAEACGCQPAPFATRQPEPA